MQRTKTVEAKDRIVAIDPEFHRALVLASAHDPKGRSMKAITQESLLKDTVFTKQYKALKGGKV